MNYTSTGKTYPSRQPELVIPEGGEPGQILVRTAHGMEWIDRVVRCNIIEEENGWSCDKTFEELKTAYEAGSELIAYVNGYICRLSEYQSDRMIFSLLLTDDTSFNNTFVQIYARLTNAFIDVRFSSAYSPL